MSDVLGNDRFELKNQQSMRVALAMLRRRLLELEVSEFMISKLMTVSSELALNVLKYATHGTLILKRLKKAQKHGLQISVEDEGPGIADVDQALQDHYSSGDTLGLELPGVKRMVDEFKLESEVGKGTRVDATVWL